MIYSFLQSVNQFSISPLGGYLGTSTWGEPPPQGGPGDPPGGPGTLSRGGTLSGGVPCPGGVWVPCPGGTLSRGYPAGGYPATLPGGGGSYLCGVQAATELFCCELALYSLMPHGIMGNVAKHHGSKKKKKNYGMGTPPLWTDRLMDGQTCVKTLPSRRTTYAGGNNIALRQSYICVQTVKFVLDGQLSMMSLTFCIIYF